MGRQWDSEKQEFVDDDSESSYSGNSNYSSEKEFPELRDRKLANENYIPPKLPDLKFPKLEDSDDSE